MSKNGRKAISFSEADHDLIVNEAVSRGYVVWAGSKSQLGKFVLDCVKSSTQDNFSRDEKEQEEK